MHVPLQPLNRGVEQLVARRAHNPKVVGSSPASATKKEPRFECSEWGLFVGIMYTVYVLYTRLYAKTYVGFTSDLSGRLRSHNELGQKGWTMKYRPWELVFTEEYGRKSEAMAREKWLKSGVGREYLQARIVQWLKG